jgi:hypothetical protein
MAITEAILANKLQVVVAGMVVMGGAGATYVAMGGSIPFMGADGMADSVPEDVDVVMYMDPGVAEDETTADLVNGLINISKDQQGEFYSGPDDYEAVMEQAESNSSLDIDDLNSVTVYGKYPDNASSTVGMAQDSYVGVLVNSEWSEAEFMNEVENGTDYEEDEYEGRTIYEQTSASAAGTEGYIGVLGDGQYVIGTEDAVEDAIDVETGSMDPFSGDLRTAYDDTRSGENTYLKFAANFPEEETLEQAGTGVASSEQFTAVTNIAAMSGSYYTDGDGIGMQMRLETGNEDDADDLAALVDGGVTTVKQSARTNETQRLLDEVEVSRDGTVVKMTFESPVDRIVGAWEAAIEAWSGAMGTTYSSDGGSGASYSVAPSVGPLAATDPDPIMG